MNCARSFAFLFFVAAAGILPQSVVRADSALGFAYDDVTECSNSIVKMNSLEFDCNNGDGSCTLGDEVTFTGQFTTTLPIPGEVNIKIQICKFWGNLCTPYLVEQDVDLCSLLDDSGDGVDDDEGIYCAKAGTYDYQTNFVLPESSLNNFAVNGVSFRIYVLVNGEFTCHAQFKTVKSSSDSSATTAVSLLGIVGLILSVLSVQEVGKRRRRTIALVDLQVEERIEQQPSTEQIEFEKMHDTSMYDHYVTL